MDIVVKAKVLRLEEEELESFDDSVLPVKREFVWGQIGIPVTEIRYYWGQSKNRCVIEMKAGRLILVAITFDELKDEIQRVRDEMSLIQWELEEPEEDELILGEKEEGESGNSEDI